MFLSGAHLPTHTIVDAEFVALTRLRSFIHKYKTEVFGGMLGADSEAAAFDEPFLEAAQEGTNRQFQAWMAGSFHSQDRLESEGSLEG